MTGVVPGAEIAYRAGDRDVVGRLFDGSGGKPAPGIVVFHEGMGRTDHELDAARRLADAGYVTLAADVFGEPITSREQAFANLGALMNDLDTLRARATAALDVLRAQPTVDPLRLGAIGFCFGGTTALELARSGADLRCTVGFHSGLGTNRPDDASAIAGRVLVCIGADDPVVPPAQRDAFVAEMTAGKVDWQMLLLGGVGHSFTNRAVPAGMPGFAYDAAADRRSWAAMKALFAECFGVAT